MQVHLPKSNTTADDIAKIIVGLSIVAWRIAWRGLALYLAWKMTWALVAAVECGR